MERSQLAVQETAAPSATAHHTLRGQQDCEVIITRNHEYYVSDGVCFAERERSSGRYRERSSSVGVARPQALGSGREHERHAQNASFVPESSEYPMTSVRALTIAESAGCVPRVGEWLCLRTSGSLWCTGPVLAVERRVPRASK
jgi:hypothetical protein